MDRRLIIDGYTWNSYHSSEVEPEDYLGLMSLLGLSFRTAKDHWSEKQSSLAWRWSGSASSLFPWLLRRGAFPSDENNSFWLF